MLFSALLFATVVRGSVLAFDYRPDLAMIPTAEPWVNPDGGNVIVGVSSRRITWGSWRPNEVILEILKQCQPTHCPRVVALETHVVQPDRKGVKVMTLKVSLDQSTFPPDGLGQLRHVFDAFHGFLSLGEFTSVENVHWDAETEGQGCQPQSPFCGPIENIMQGDVLQFTAPQSVSIRVGNEQGGVNNMVSSVILEVETVSEGGDEWDCNKIVQVAGSVAGMMSGLPQAGFVLGELFCGVISKESML